MDLGLAGARAFVTGASGGIGWAIAEALAAEGARLALHAHRHTAELEERLATLPGGRAGAAVFTADIADPEAVEAAFAGAAERFGGIDLCVANAGVWATEAHRLDEMPAERIRRTLDIDLLGALWTARAFLRQLARAPRPAAAGGASLTFIGSTAGRFGEKGHCDYSVAKAGLYGLLRTLKNEIVLIDPAGRVNLIEPGWTLTSMAAGALADEERLRRIVRTMPLRQIARAEDIAASVLFLASPRAARHISGEILTVAGGMEGRLLWREGEIDTREVRRRSEP